MDKNVIVSVSGMLFAQGKGGESEDVEVISPGEYHWKNGKHYIRYVEINEEFEEPIMNTLKISPDEVSIMRARWYSTGEISRLPTILRRLER